MIVEKGPNNFLGGLTKESMVRVRGCQGKVVSSVSLGECEPQHSK